MLDLAARLQEALLKRDANGQKPVARVPKTRKPDDHS
jgi:hypothetical protein